jgi:uncharacterized protein YjbI with pentapeptide repeats
MANPEHLAILKQGVEVWNAWRAKAPSVLPDLSDADLLGAKLDGANLGGSNLRGAILTGANLCGANLWRTNLSKADLSEADLCKAKLGGTDLFNANLSQANLAEADLRDADVTEAKLRGANLSGVNLRWANLSQADLAEANLRGVDLSGGNLRWVNLSGANLRSAKLGGTHIGWANLSGANASGANLSGAVLLETNLVDAVLTGCHIYGVSAWNLKLSEHTKQQDLVITAPHEPEVSVDNIEVAQFVYLLLHNEKIRDVIDTVGRKGVLLLGRFTEGRIAVLERLREALRQRGYIPIVFNFDKPETKDFTETVRLLAGMAKFVIADITNPKSTPLELQATIPEMMIPFQPIIQEGEQPFAMLQDLWIKHRDWVFEPIEYSSVDRLIEAFDSEIIVPAETRFNELVLRKAERMTTRRV